MEYIIVNTNLKVGCEKIAEGVTNCNVAVRFIYDRELLDIIYIPKSRVKAKEDGLEKYLMNQIKDYTFDLNDSEMGIICRNIRNVMNGAVNILKEKYYLNEVLEGLYKKAKENEVGWESDLYVYQGCICIKYDRVQNVLVDYGFDTFKELEFKRQLKMEGLLITDKDRYDHKLYTINDIKAPTDGGVRYLMIHVGRMQTWFVEIEDQEEV